MKRVFRAFCSMPVQKKRLFFSPLALVFLSACKNGETLVSGSIVKGPLSNALVFLDLDGDYFLDDNEESIRTDVNGNFSINTTATSYKIVALTDESTIDTSSGATLSGVMLTAPEGAAVVTPTTTLMEEGGLSASEIIQVLNLPDAIDPLNFNPFSDEVNSAVALEVEKISQQIMTVIGSFASVAEGAGMSEMGAFNAALNSVVEIVKVKAENLDNPSATAAERSLDFTSASDLNLIKDEIANEAETIATLEGSLEFDKDALNAVIDDTATSIKNVNDQIQNTIDLTSESSKNVFSTIQVLMDQVKNAAATEAISPGTGSIDFVNIANVLSASQNQPPSDIQFSFNQIPDTLDSLVIGNFDTIDVDQASEADFIYRIAEVHESDFGLFEINESTGELKLKEDIEYDLNTSYQLTIVSVDDGGKSFSKNFSLATSQLFGGLDINHLLSNYELPDTSPPEITHFSIVNSEVAIGEELKILFKANDATHVGYFNAIFSSIDQGDTKVFVNAQNESNAVDLLDHYSFALNSDGFYEVNVPLLIEGELISGVYELDFLALSDANTNIDPALNNEVTHSSDISGGSNSNFISNLNNSNRELTVNIPVFDNNQNLPIMNETESNARLDIANTILVENLVKGTVWPDGEDWFRFDLNSEGTITAQLDVGNGTADLKLFSPDGLEVASQEVSGSGMIYHHTSELDQHYVLVTDSNVNNLAYELIIDIV